MYNTHPELIVLVIIIPVTVIFNPLLISSKIVALIYVLYYPRRRRYINFNIGLAWQRKNLNLPKKLVRN